MAVIFSIANSKANEEEPLLKDSPDKCKSLSSFGFDDRSLVAVTGTRVTPSVARKSVVSNFFEAIISGMVVFSTDALSAMLIVSSDTETSGVMELTIEAAVGATKSLVFPSNTYPSTL